MHIKQDVERARAAAVDNARKEPEESPLQAPGGNLVTAP